MLCSKIEELSLIEEDWRKGLLIVQRDGKEQIIGGYPDRLLSHLADFEQQGKTSAQVLFCSNLSINNSLHVDRDYVNDFLCSFRSFLEPSEVLDFLINRYRTAKYLQGMGVIESVQWEKYNPLLQSRVINVLRKWLASHFYDFKEDARLLEKLMLFLEDYIEKNKANEQQLKALKLLILEQVRCCFIFRIVKRC